MQDITNTVAHTPALPDTSFVSLATQAKATQVFFLDLVVLHDGLADVQCCSVPLRLTLPI